MKTQLDFHVSTKDIIRFLGEENYENKNSALYELIKNSYDASAKKVIVEFNEDSIVVSDNGEGMTKDKIYKNWMNIGFSDKRDDNDNNRSKTGEKGIGRLAIARLGKSCKLITKSENSISYIWESNWETNTINEYNYNKIGTLIEINELRDKWNSNDINKFKAYISTVVKKENFDVVIKYKNETDKIDNVFKNFKQNENYFMKFNFVIKDDKCKVFIDNQIFEESLIQDLKLEDKKEISISLNTNLLEGVTGEMYYGFRITKKSKADFGYRPNPGQYKIIQQYNEDFNGIVLYRNGFSVQGYEGKKDWLGLDARARVRNKAIGDMSGKTAFKKNNIYGFINIDKYKNRELIDMSNRQGLVFNEAYEYLISTISEIFEEVEDYYKKENIKEIVTYYNNNKSKSTTDKQMQEYNKQLKLFKSLSNESKIQHIIEDPEKYIPYNEINKLEDEKDNLINDSFHLQTYATQAISINTISHDLKNELKSVGYNPQKIRDIIINHGYEDTLIENTKSLPKYKNYKKLSDELIKAGEKLDKHITVHLKGIKKERFILSEIDTKSYFEELEDNFSVSNYFKMNYKYNLKSFNFYKSTLDIIYNNLIDNSIKNNLTMSNLEISTNLEITEENIIIDYEDNGCGLDEKYTNRPNDILLLHETTNNYSSGLGMWIIASRVKIYSGEIIIYDNIGQGFKIRIILRTGEFK